MSRTPPASPLPASGDAPVDRTAGDRAICSRADVATGTPARYAKQLISHLGRKVAFTGDTATAPATAVIGAATAGIAVGEGVARVEQVLGSHLERFAHREALTVRWARNGGAPTPTSPVMPIEESA
jgi:hypothetical protein